jgi:hypothetical protein
MWHIVRRGINLKKVERFPRSKVIGTKSRHGTVRPLMYKGNKFLLVSKEVPIEKKKSFAREIHVGSMRGIESCGPRIYAWRIQGDKCEYIMDNLARGHSDARVRTLAQTRVKPWRKVYDSLLKFYKVTGGYHGDLHENNIAVITRGKTVSVQIYDYGTWHPFYKRVTGNKILPYLVAAKAKPGNVNRGNGVYKPKNNEQLYTMNFNSLGGNAIQAFKRYNGVFNSPATRNSLFNVSP